MPLRLNRNQLIELIEEIEAGGGDATELRRELEALGPDQRPPRRRTGWRNEEEKETTEERLNRRVGDLFPNKRPPFEQILDYDYHFTLKELREQCRKAGISISGDKKELAAKLIAHGQTDSARMKEENIWQQIEEILVREDVKESILEMLHELYKRRPERFWKYKEIGYIPRGDILPLINEYGEALHAELKAGTGKAPPELLEAAAKYVRTIIELYKLP